MRTGIHLLKEDIRRYGLAVFLLLIYLFVVGVLLGLPVCPMVYMTGLPCPACGMTRALVCFLQGDFSGAFVMHPFFYVLLLWAAAAVFVRYFLGRSIKRMEGLVYVIAAAAMAFYFWRMWNYFPETEPMVYWEGAVFSRFAALFR